MIAYYINKDLDEDGEHEIHRSGCEYMPRLGTRAFLGNYESTEEAIELAKKLYDEVMICPHCCGADEDEE